MKISFNPSNSNKNILDLIKNNKDIIFDLKGHSIFARGVEFKGTDTNTWRPVVDNLTSDSTTSSLSAKQGKVLKALIDGKSNSDHNHDGRYLKLTGGTMASNALITFADSGSWDTSKKPQGARGGLYWTGQSDYAKLYAEETVGDNLDLVIQFGDDNSNGLSIRNKANTQTSYISSSGVITTGTFKGNLDWSYITNKPATATRWPSWAEVTGKPSSFTPSTHTHGLSNSVFFLNMPSINGNAKWKEVFGYPVNYNLLLSVRINNPAPEWCVGNFGSGILYGGSDTKGFMSSAYNEPFIMWAGGNGSSDDSVPKWYIGIKGTHKSIYNLATIASEANAAYNLRHSHANKSVLDGITSALVNSWNTAYNFVSNITGTDTDKVINKWEEIVNFLAGITEDNKLNTLLNSKLSIQQLSAKDILTTKTNNALFWVDTKGNASTITTGPFTDHPYALLSVTNYNQNAENHKFFYRSRLAFSSAGDIKVASCHHENEYQQDETWYNVLTSKNSGINGSTIKLNGTSITVYSSGTADGRYVKKSGDTMQGVLTIDTTNFGALTIKRNDDANGASIQFRGKSSVYGYIGLNNSTKDKQFLRWSSDTSRIYTILDTSSTYISNGKGVINGTTITQVDNATNSTNSTNARKLVNWYSARPTSLNAQFGDGSLRIFYATSSTTEGKPAEDSHILHLAWDNTGGYDAQLAVHIRSGKVSTRAQNGGTWQPWKTLAFTTDIPSSLKNPYSFNVFGVVYDGSAAKTVTTSNFISQVNEGTSTITDGTMLITSYATNNGFADTNAVNVPYKRKAIHLWEYIKAKTDSLYATKGHNHDGIYVRAFRTSNDNIDSDWGQSFKTFDPVPLGTPPEQNPNISLLSIGENFNRRKQLAFIWNNDNIYYRRRIDSGFTNWRRLAFVDQIPTSLKNPHALTISLNGTSQGPYDGSAAKNINITPGSIGAAVSNHSHDYLVVNSADDKSFNSAYHNFQVLYAGGGNGITGKPANVDAFGLFKFRAASGWSGQMLLANGGSLYIRSSEDAKMTNTLAWKTILDSSNYSGILDSRYYTESEVNSLLDAKLNRQNLWGNMFDGTNNIYGRILINPTNATGSYDEGIRIKPHNNWSVVVLCGNDNTADTGTSANTWGLFNNNGNFCINRNGSAGHTGYELCNINGNWGVGTNSPVCKLHVNGAGHFTDYVNIPTLRIYGTSDNMSWNRGPGRIIFAENTSDDQALSLVYTSYDSVRYPAGIKLTGSQGNEWFEAPRIIKTGSSDSYVLLGGGGHKAISDFAISTHTHGLLHSDLTVTLANTTTDSGWSMINSSYNGFLLKSIRTWGSAPNWIEDNYAAGICFGGADTKGVVSVAYNRPYIKFAGGNGSKPVWWIRLSGISGATYNLANFNADMVDGYHANGLLTALSNSNNGISITVGGTTKSVSNISVNYASSAGNANTLDGYPANGSNFAPYGHIPTIESDGVMEVGKYIDFHNDNNGKHDFSTRLQSTGNYGNDVNLPSASGTLALTSDILNYYWANVKISTSSSTTTSPTVSNLTATSSIRMSNISLEHTDEINNITNGGIHLNYRNSGNVSLCYGGGNVGIGTTTPSYKLHVNGQIMASGFHHASHNDDSYVLLAGGGTSHIKHGSTYWSTAIQFGNYVWLMLQIGEASNGISVVPTNISNPTKDIYVMNAQLGNYNNSRHGRYRVAPNGVLYYVDGVAGMQIYTTICYVVNS